MFSPSEKDVLAVFRSYKVTPGELLCFSEANLQKHKTGLRKLAARKMLIKERFKSAYSLTPSGYAAMANPDRKRK